MESTSAKNTVGEVPALADTDAELWADCIGDYISAWMRNSRHFISEQQEKMYRMALCPFLFGVSRNLPQAWLEVLRTYSIVEKDRENITSPLSESQLETLDMAETVFMRCSQLVSNKNDLKTILNFIHDVEDRSALSGRIDMSYALQEVSGLEVFSSMWAPIKRFYEKRKRQAHVCIIYYFKIISYHVIQYGQNGIDRADFVESMLFDLFRPDQSEVTIEEAQKTFDGGNYKLAVEQYSALIEREPLNCCLYDQRSAAYLQLCDYWAALSDCRRAIVLKPTDYLHYYRAAKLYLELGQLEKAEDFGHQSLEHAADASQRALVEQLTQEIRAARRGMTKARDASTSSGSEERDICYTQYRKLICEGSDLHLSHVYGRAAEQFKAALDVIARSTSEELAIEGDDLAFIWLLYGLSCVKAENTRNIPAAIEKFNAIISRTAAFPAAFYGLALAYVQLKRYQEAGAVLVAGLARLGDVRARLWPGTNTVVEETVGPTLKKLMEDLLNETKFPPKPDAVCKFHVDTDNLKKEMYFSDPDYKGHVCIKCRANCSLDCHAQCWKPNDCNSRGKHNWKEVLDTPCPTPECWGTISEVLICRPDPDKTLKLCSQLETKPQIHQPRPKLKMKTASASKLEKKMEMKRLRKERRQEARQEFLDQQANEEQLENTSTRIILPADEEVVNIDRTGTVLRKDEPEMLTEKKPKVSKSKKKEKRQKQFLAVDLQFKGDEEKERYGINSLDDEGDAVNSPDIGLLPTPGSEPSTSPSTSLPLQQPALEIALYEFFYKILLAKGPLDLLSQELEDHTKHLCEEAQAYILSYGGLGRFLAAHHQFFVSQNKSVSAIPASLLGNPPLKPLLTPQVNPGLMPQGNLLLAPQVKPLLAPQVKPLLAPKVKPLLAPKVKPLMAPLVNPGSRPQAKPLLAPPVKPLLAPQVIASLVPQINAWETRQNKPTEAQHARAGKGHGLNPGAKEFVPLDTAGAAGVANSQQGLADGAAEITEDLPPPAADDDDGFTTVVNKKRINVQKLPSVVQPNVQTFAFLKPASSMNSLDEIPVDSPLSQRAQALVGASEGDQPQVDGHRQRRTSRGNIDSLDNFWDAASDMEPCARKGKMELTTRVMSPVINKTAPASDVSDISWADLHHRVSSPALSTNSSCSSGKAEGSQVSNQMSSQATAPRPLKAPSILLPTRGKNKRPLAPKLYGPQQPLAADGSHDGCEEESVSSTTSDRDSACGDARALNVDKLHMPPVTASAGKDRISVIREPVSLSSGRDVFSSLTHDSSLRVQHPSRGMETKVVGGSGVVFKTPDSDGMITRSQGFGAGIQEWSNMWPESPTAEKVPLDSSLGDLKVMVKSGNAADERQETNRKTVYDNLAFEAPSPQTQAQVLKLVTKRSDDQSEVSMRSVPDATWSSWGWGLPDSYGKASDGGGDDVRVPPSDPWQNQDQATAPVHTDLFGESPEMASMSAGSHTSHVNHLLSDKDKNSPAFYVGPFSREYGLIGSGKVKDNDPWSSRSVVSPTSLSADISFHSHRSTASPFPAWMPAHSPSSSHEPRMQSSSATGPSVYKSGTSTGPSIYTSNTTTEPSICTSSTSAKPSVSTNVSSIKPSGTLNEPLSFSIDTSSGSLLHRSLTKPSLNRSVIEPTVPSPSFSGAAILLKHKHPEHTHLRTNDERIAHSWEHEQVNRENTDLTTAQCRSADTQTDLSRTQIDEMLESTNLLKDLRAQLASVLHEKLELQEQLSQERSANDQLRHDNRRLLTKVHVAETSAEKWKDDCSQLIQTEQLLNAQVQTQTETICQLTTQMDQLKTTYLNAQMDMLTTRKELTNSKLDMKQQEALHHYHRLSNLITQSKTSDKKLPESVYEKLTEFSEYIAMCDRLSRHVEVLYLRLAGDLQRGQVVDMAELQLSPPTFPKSPRETSERPQASTNSLPHVDSSSGVQPSPAASLTSVHSSPSRAHSSMHSSPSHSRQSPSPPDISSLHSSPSRSGASGRTSPSRSTTSGLSPSPRGKVSDHSSPALGINHQTPAWSALKSEAWPQEAENDDADAYLKMIYGGGSSADPQVKVTGAIAASKTQDVDHKKKVPDLAGRQGWNASSSRLLPSPARLPAPTGHVPQGDSGTRILPGPTQSRPEGERAQTTSVPNIRAQLKPHASHSGPGHNQQQLPHFERIVQTVQDKLPECSRSEIQKVVDTLRRNSGGTLSEWTFEALANEILEMILDLEQGQDLATFTDGCGPDEQPPTSIWEYEAVERTCSICQCVVQPTASLTLSCGHTFHEACAQKWLTNERSCPNCRSHAFLAQDFPVLK